MACLFRTTAVLWRCGCAWRSWRTSPPSSVWARSGTGMAMRQNVHYDIFSKVGAAPYYQWSETAKGTFSRAFFLRRHSVQKYMNQVEGLMLHQLHQTYTNYCISGAATWQWILQRLQHKTVLAQCTTQQMWHFMIFFNDCSKIKYESSKISNVCCHFLKNILSLWREKLLVSNKSVSWCNYCKIHRYGM